MSKKIHVRPGKGQSKFGFAVGIIFCLIGLFFCKQIDSHVVEIDEKGEDVTVTT